VWFTERLFSNGCLSPTGQTVLTKVTPAGVAWQRTLPHVRRCIYGSPHLNATPSGVVLTSLASDDSGNTGGADVQYVASDGSVGWHRFLTPPSETLINSVQPPRVDEHGQVVVPQVFVFGCSLWGGRCAGVQVDRLGADGTDLLGQVLLKGSEEANQQSWGLSTTNPLAITPNRVVAALRTPTPAWVSATSPTVSTPSTCPAWAPNIHSPRCGGSPPPGCGSRTFGSSPHPAIRC
jgi:hypothetical protein